MAERTSVTQVVQIGVETTEGTAVAANKSLPSLMFDVQPEGNVEEIRASGTKFPTIHAPGRDWTTAKISGQPTYDEIVYLLSSILETATITTVDTSGRSWAFTPSSTAPDTVKSFTIEQGSSVRAHKFAGGLVTELTLKGDKDKVELSGSVLGRAFTDGITLTTTPTAIAQIPILAKEFDIWLDDTSGGLGTTKFTRILSWELSLKNRFGPLFAVNTADTSYAASVELPVTGEFKFRAEADSQAMGLLTTVRAGATKFVRLKATSAQLAGAVSSTYAMTWDLACNVKEFPKSIGDTDGVYAVDMSLGIKHDGTWGQALLATVVNKLAAL